MLKKLPPKRLTGMKVSNTLLHQFSSKQKTGFCIWLTGLSCSGKSTTALALEALLKESGYQITMLDGDVVRRHISEGLGYSREDRNKNIARIGFIASEIVRHGGIVICAVISPYEDARRKVRDSIPSGGNFVEVFVDTPLHECEKRDTKGLYAKARRGELKSFTGIDDPYEPPLNPELILNTVSTTPFENAKIIFAKMNDLIKC